MSQSTPNFFVRLLTSLWVFFRYIFDGDFAAHVRSGPDSELKNSDAARPQQDAQAVETNVEERVEKDVKPTPMTDFDTGSALQLLALLQQDARLVDFVEEDLTGFSDADIGAAARVVHEGCRKALRNHFELTAVNDQPEQSQVKLEPGYDAAKTRVVGNVTGEPPFTGVLIHRGWQVAKVTLPSVTAGHDLTIIAPAEVEL